jgi:hypothetical protein
MTKTYTVKSLSPKMCVLLESIARGEKKSVDLSKPTAYALLKRGFIQDDGWANGHYHHVSLTLDAIFVAQENGWIKSGYIMTAKE